LALPRKSGEQKENKGKGEKHRKEKGEGIKKSRDLTIMDVFGEDSARLKNDDK
jgi:hypothetical protein